jgi:hypothetical protein
LLHFALDHAPGIELLAANVPIRRANGHGVQTLGELDVVWRDPASWKPCIGKWRPSSI